MFVEYDDNAFPYPQTIGKTANSISGLGPADETMIDTIFIMPNKSTNPDATLMIVVDEKEPSTDPKTYQYVYVGNINDLPSDVLTEESIVDNLTTERNDRPLSANQGRTLNSHVNYTTCGSNAEDQVKLISDDGFELSTNLRLLVKMNNTNTNSTPKFNINNTGVKDVWYNGSVASDTNTWSAGEVLDVYYDDTKYIANTHGGAQFSTGEKVGDVGIDAEPTANSNNLVKSGGVYSTIRVKFLTYNTDASTTRAQVLQADRLSGMILSYYNRTKWIVEQNVHNYDQQSDANWLDDSQWMRITTASDIASVITLINNLDAKADRINKPTDTRVFYKTIKTIGIDECLRGMTYAATTGLPNYGNFDPQKARFNPIPISHTAVYKYTGVVRSSSEPGIIYTDENFNVISSEIIGTGSEVQHTNEILTVPYNAKFILASCSVFNDNFKVTIEDFEQAFTDKNEFLKLNGKKIAVTYTWLDDPSSYQFNRLNSNGTISVGSSYSKVSDYISIDNNKLYFLTASIDIYRCGIAFYDNDNHPMGAPQIWYPQSNAIKSGFFIPPKESTKIRICSTEPNKTELGYLEDTELITKYQGTENAENFIEIDENGNIVPSSYSADSFVEKSQGIAQAGKFLKVGEDGNVTLGDGTSSPTDITNCIQNKQSKTIYLGADILSGSTGSGTGWSYNNGSYTHTTGSSNALVFPVNTENTKEYVCTFTTNTASFGETNLLVSIGDKYFCDPYNGTTGPFNIGIKSDGGYLKFTPSELYNGTISNITLRPIVTEEQAETNITIQQLNVESKTMTSDITSWWNVAIGAMNALEKSENSSRNIAIGHNSLSKLESGERNIGIGTFALSNLRYGHCNICIGADTLYTNEKADYNVAVGKAAMCYMHSDFSVPYYSRNTAVGQGAMSGSGQTFTENVAIGSGAMGGETPAANSSRINNVAIGAGAGANAKVSNVAIGYQAGYYAETGNVVAGYRAGYYNKGSYNVFLGFDTGKLYVNNNNCIFIGKGAKAATGSESASNVITIDNSIVIGTDVVSDKSNQILIGSSTQTELIIMGKKIKFNNDNTVTWETIS